MASSETAHTPGPWDCTGCQFPDDDMGGVYYRIQADGIDASGANARLIAAAPELLSIVQRFIALPSGAWHPERHAAEEAELMTEAKALIAKATGAA